MGRVGIPHGLFYYYYYPLWKTFFSDLGAEVISSSESNRHTLDQGINFTVDETCLPIKIYFGHVKELCNQNLDYLFIPRLVSVEPKSYICPKFMGVPDMVRATVKDLPPLIDITIDISKTDRFLKKDILRVGRLFSSNTNKIKKAYLHACQENYFCTMLAGEGYTREEAISLWEGKQINNKYPQSDLRIGVLGHGYTLYDSFISMNLINRLRLMGCSTVLSESINPEMIEQEAATMPKRVFWTLGRKMVGSALHMDNSNEIDGIVYLACFGCGPDSLIGEIIERKVQNKPFMMLTIDEHSGEGGLVTRLEAFCDMLRRRRKSNESNLPAYG
ncbi:MAG: acyl-CoA dehydratase activase-related protein [Syntrophomonadaceae bacterium]|jgi:predicted nucleotide-binding protein (sugar kinase/HSP70/actin superfamily)